jgi:hypothetical protein
MAIRVARKNMAVPFTRGLTIGLVISATKKYNGSKTKRCVSDLLLTHPFVDSRCGVRFVTEVFRRMTTLSRLRH